MSIELLQVAKEPTLAQWQARQIVKMAAIMAHFVESTREDKLRWRPAVDENSKTRSVLEQVGECIFANIRFRHYFLSETPPAAPAEWDNVSSVQDAITQLKESARCLAEVIAGWTAEDLAKEYKTHRGPMPGLLAIQFPLRNMTYHIGQINMIQLLYGDTDFHITEEFTTV